MNSQRRQANCTATRAELRRRPSLARRMFRAPVSRPWRRKVRCRASSCRVRESCWAESVAFWRRSQRIMDGIADASGQTSRFEADAQAALHSLSRVPPDKSLCVSVGLVAGLC